MKTTTSWTIDTISALGPTTDVVTAGRILGIGRTTSYALAKNGTFPIVVIAAGSQYRVPTQAIINALYPTVSQQGDAR